MKAQEENVNNIKEAYVILKRSLYDCNSVSFAPARK